MSNFSFSHSVFKRLVLQTRENKGLFGKGLIYKYFEFDTDDGLSSKCEKKNDIGIDNKQTFLFNLSILLSNCSFSSSMLEISFLISVVFNPAFFKFSACLCCSLNASISSSYYKTKSMMKNKPCICCLAFEGPTSKVYVFYCWLSVCLLPEQT